MRKRKSKILEAVHESVKGLFAAGAIDQVTMRHFDRLERRRLRERVRPTLKALLLTPEPRSALNISPRGRLRRRRPGGTN